MDDTLLIDAVERFVNGEMSEQERIYFEDLRKNNPELDQSVVEHMFFLNQLKEFGTGVGFGTNTKVVDREKDSKQVIEAQLRKFFSPEFLNRIDDVVVFNNLSAQDTQEITRRIRL